MRCSLQAMSTGSRHMRGVTLVELIAFIIIVAIVASAMVQAFSGTMRGSHFGKETTQAAQLAQQRMDVILGQVKLLRGTVGYAGITALNYDPCPPVGAWANQACADGGYNVTSTFSAAANACSASSGTDCILLTVSVTAPNNDVLSRLTYQVWNY